MPKYVERDKVRPIPGAFGLERSKEAWEKRNRASAGYLSCSRRYSNHLYIFVEEEYGYRSYLWVYPGEAEELVEDWCNGRTPWGNRNGLGRRFKGEFDAVEFESPESERGLPWPRSLQLVLCETGEVFEGFRHLSDFDGSAHIHEEEDSALRVGYYEVRGVREPKVTIHVLDALAAI